MPIQQMPEQQVKPGTYGDHTNAIYKAALNIRAGQTNRLEQEKLQKENALLDLKASPENQNRLKAESDAELQKKQNDAKIGSLELYSKRLAAITDVDDFGKALPTLMKDLVPIFGEEGAKQLLPRVTMKKDLSGQKEIPDNEAFIKDRDRIADALDKVSGKVKTKPGDKITWTEDIKDEATGKMKTVDLTKVLQADGTWATHQATYGGIKDTVKAPETKTFQVGGKEVPHQWDEAAQKWNPIKGMGGPKWNPKEDKPDMTEPQAREKLFQLTKYESQLDKTGGVDEILFAMIAKDNPELAKQMQGADKTEAKKFINEQKEYYKGFTKSGKKSETPTAKTGTGKKPPAGYKDTGRTQGGKKVYSDGKNAWVE
jgi:hypothetical protein